MERMNVWVWLLLALLVYLTYRVFAPFLVPLAWASVLAICFFPLHRRIRDRLRTPSLAALVTVLLVALIIVGPAVLVMGSFATEGVQAVGDFQHQLREGKLPGLDRFLRALPVTRVSRWLKKHAGVDEAALRGLAEKQFERLAGYIAGTAAGLARDVIVFVLELLITLFATFYLLRDGPAALARLRSLLPLDPAHRERLLHTAHDVLYASVYASLLIAALQGTLGGLLFWILGIRSPVFWGVAMAFFSFLPVVGAWVVWLPAAVYFLLEGQMVRAVVLVGVGGLVIGMVDNLVRPWLISGHVQLNGLLVFISVLGGLAAFGPIGLLLGPIIVALGVAVLDAYTAPEPATSPADPSAQ